MQTIRWPWRIDVVQGADRAGGAPARGAEIVLGRDTTRSFLARAGGIAVECLAGSVWVTFEGAPEDHVLGPGERRSWPRRGRLAVWALEPSRARIFR